MRLSRPLFWIGSAVLLAVVLLIGVGSLGESDSPSVALAEQGRQSSASAPAPVTERNQRTSPRPEPARPALPASVAAPSHAATSPTDWQRQRKAFLQGKDFAVSIQQALSTPTAARLFYALKVLDLCSDLHTMGASTGGGADSHPAAEACEEALLMNPSQVEFFAKLRSARLDSANQALLDAVDGKGSALGTSFVQRFAAVSPTDDPLLIAELGSAWARSRNPTFHGQALTDESRVAFQEAWALAACEATSSCESSMASARLCTLQQQCTGTLQNRVASTMTKEEYETLLRYTAAIKSALRSRDFSAFN